MEEANLRVLRPYRRFLPIPEWFRFRSRMAKLNAFLINFFRCVCVCLCGGWGRAPCMEECLSSSTADGISGL